MRWFRSDENTQHQFCSQLKSFHCIQGTVFTSLLIFSHMRSFCLVCYVRTKNSILGRQGCGWGRGWGRKMKSYNRISKNFRSFCFMVKKLLWKKKTGRTTETSNFPKWLLMVMQRQVFVVKLQKLHI